LPSEGYLNIAQLSAAPYRMGLTATVEREDGRHQALPEVVGPIVYRVSPSELAGKYIAEYDIEVIRVNMEPEEKEKYKELREKFKGFLRSRGLTVRSLEDFRRLIGIASRDREAREALLAWHEATSIAVNSNAKIRKLEELLPTLHNEKVIIFTRNNYMAYSISKRFLVPVITYKVSKEERREILEAFREGKYRVIVTSNVLDEGIDVPDASVAIVMGGYGTSRQFLQRLGRILRKSSPQKRARLIEIVTRGTVDSALSRRRKSATQ